MSTLDGALLALLLAAVLLAAVWWARRTAVLERDAARRERVAANARAQEAAQASTAVRRQLDRVGEAALNGLLILDGTRRVLWGNQGAWDMFSSGRPSNGQVFIGLVQDAELNQAVVDALGRQRPIDRQVASDGRTLRLRAVPLDGGAGVAVAIEDVSELQRLGRARRDFVANISHDLRTPLASIELAAQTLRRAGGHDSALTERMLDQIHSQVEALTHLSQAMMDLAQIESGQVLLKLVPTAVEPLVRRAVDLLLPQAALKDQQVTAAVANGLVGLMDEQQILRVLGNLLHNAIKFTPEHRTICITAEPSGEEDILLCVIDDGPGIPDSERKRIFERFYKQDRARSDGGTGLGLAIARHIVEGHGGQIWVEREPEHGAKFCFTVPRA